MTTKIDLTKVLHTKTFSEVPATEKDLATSLMKYDLMYLD